MNSQELRDYWFSTGTPTFLIKLVQEKGEEVLKELDDFVIDEMWLTYVGNMKDAPIPMMYANGLLTIRGYNRDEELYQLKIPNEEVQDFFTHILPKSSQN